MTHCKALTKLCSRYLNGTTPQPASHSMSPPTHLRGVPRPDCAYWRMVSPDAVTVWPNMIWPTSMLTFGFALTASASCSAAEENFFGPSVP